MGPWNPPAAPAFLMILLALAGCGRESVQVAFSHNKEGFLIKVSTRGRSFQIKVEDDLSISRLGKMSYPDGHFTTSQYAPLVFGVEDHDFVIDQGLLKSGSVIYGHVAGGQEVVFNLKGVFVDGKRLGDFPPGD